MIIVLVVKYSTRTTAILFAVRNILSFGRRDFPHRRVMHILNLMQSLHGVLLGSSLHIDMCTVRHGGVGVRSSSQRHIYPVTRSHLVKLYLFIFWCTFIAFYGQMLTGTICKMLYYGFVMSLTLDIACNNLNYLYRINISSLQALSVYVYVRLLLTVVE